MPKKDSIDFLGVLAENGFEKNYLNVFQELLRDSLEKAAETDGEVSVGNVLTFYFHRRAVTNNGLTCAAKKSFAKELSYIRHGKAEINPDES